MLFYSLNTAIKLQYKNITRVESDSMKRNILLTIDNLLNACFFECYATYVVVLTNNVNNKICFNHNARLQTPAKLLFY